MLGQEGRFGLTQLERSLLPRMSASVLGQCLIHDPKVSHSPVRGRELGEEFGADTYRYSYRNIIVSRLDDSSDEQHMKPFGGQPRFRTFVEENPELFFGFRITATLSSAYRQMPTRMITNDALYWPLKRAVPASSTDLWGRKVLHFGDSQISARFVEKVKAEADRRAAARLTG